MFEPFSMTRNPFVLWVGTVGWALQKKIWISCTGIWAVKESGNDFSSSFSVKGKG